MSENWYPEKVIVGPEGVPRTYEFMKTAFESDQRFNYAEFGIYKADTARNICNLFPNSILHLFDYHRNIEEAKIKLASYKNTIYYYGNSQKYNDSYNWSLIKLISENNEMLLFDYCFIDGAHTVAIDALTYFLCDKLLKTGGYMDFDDYSWRLRGSSLDPSKIPAIAEQYTDEQIDAYQVKMIIEALVKRDVRYKEVIKDKIFRKL
jgi:hypothetical protein